MRVNFLMETPSLDCGCASLLEHWESASHRKASRCSVAGCIMPAGDAIAVSLSDETDPHRYVAPVCRGHAIEKGQTVELRNNAQLVKISLLTTCVQRIGQKIAT